MIRKKVLLLGDFHVGKTSLIRRFVENSFSDRYLTTIGVKISRKRIDLPEQEALEMMIWDIEGATPVKAIPRSYLQGAAGAIIVGDVTRSETLEDLRRHVEDFRRVNPESPWVIAYNKIDLLPAKRFEPPVESSFEGDAFQTSAKEGIHVNEMFLTLAQRILS
jgi:small GTP-binding protein